MFNMNRRKHLEILTYFILLIVFLAPRMAELDSFATLDEPYWLSMGANFYYALGQREFQNTVYEYQPAVTTMWIVTLAMVHYFPEYRGLGQGYLEFEKGALDPFLLDHGKDPLILLQEARFIQVVLIALLFLLLYYLLQRILPRALALFAVVFASFDPYLLGQSRLLNHEGMVSLFAVLCVLAFYVFLVHDSRMRFLVLSGAMFGFAQLTKSSSIAILFPIAILLVIQIVARRDHGWFKSILTQAAYFGIWLVISVAIYFIFWPGMWVAPGDMLYVVYGNAFSYAFQGARLTVTEELQPAQFSLNTSFAGIWDIVKVIFWRTTPLTWLGILPAFFWQFVSSKDPLIRTSRQLLLLLVSTAVGFILLFGLAQGRNSPHYLLSSYLALNLFAAAGWYFLIQWISLRLQPPDQIRLQATGLFLLVGLQLWSALAFYPYYFTYRNPILYAMGGYADFPQKPYGEGLEHAAQYLAGLPDAKDSVALTYYARGCFSFFYPGETTRFKPYYVDDGYEAELLSAIQSADYLVVYYASQSQSDRYDRFLATLSEVQPLHEIWLNDYKYAVIYDLNTLPASVLDDLTN
jgi:hypothetical protein